MLRGDAHTPPSQGTDATPSQGDDDGDGSSNDPPSPMAVSHSMTVGELRVSVHESGHQDEADGEPDLESGGDRGQSSCEQDGMSRVGSSGGEQTQSEGNQRLTAEDDTHFS